jgi:CBS domain-containing protein
MARYGRDFDRDRWGMRGNEGGSTGGFYGGGDQFGSHWRGGQGQQAQGGGQWSGGQYGGMGSDAQDQDDWGGGYHRGRNGFGTGGGSYDRDYGSGWAGNPGSWRAGGLTRGYGGDYLSGASYGYETGGGYSPGGGHDYSGGYGGGGGYDYNRGGGSGRDFETGGGMGNDWGARDTSLGGGTDRGGTSGGGWSGGGQSQDETRRMRASDIMTDNPECVTPESSLADAAAKMRDLNVGIIPVVESEQNKRLRGVVTDRDIAIRAVAEGMDARSTKVSEVMTTEVESCNKNDTVADILRVMEREQVRRVPITDREGRLVGIVAQADVVRDVDSERGEHRVNDAIEHISEPTRGGRGGMMRGSQSRGGGFGGGMGAGGSRSGGGMVGSGNRSSGGLGSGNGGRSGSGFMGGNRSGGGMSAGGSSSGTQRSGAEGMGGASNLGSAGGTDFGSGSSNIGGTGMNDRSDENS